MKGDGEWRTGSTGCRSCGKVVRRSDRQGPANAIVTGGERLNDVQLVADGGQVTGGGLDDERDEAGLHRLLPGDECRLQIRTQPAEGVGDEDQVGLAGGCSQLPVD